MLGFDPISSLPISDNGVLTIDLTFGTCDMTISQVDNCSVSISMIDTCMMSISRTDTCTMIITLTD